jgi:hypothetical protein
MTSVVHLLKERIVGSRFKTISGSENCRLEFFEKNQNQRTVGPVISKTFENLWFSQKNQQ